MKKILIRPATLGDLDTLRQFEQGVIAAERPFDPTLKPGTIHYYDIEGLMQSPESVLLVAELDGELLASGYARIQQAKAYLSHGLYAYLGFMYTVPAHRGKGLNSKILEALRAWVDSKGVHEIRLEVYSDNQSAIRAYEKAGFMRHMVEMRLASL